MSLSEFKSAQMTLNKPNEAWVSLNVLRLSLYEAQEAEMGLNQTKLAQMI